jgi:hypothetical protein
MSRWIRFIFAILVGVTAGLLYGWVVNPVEYIDTTPDTLRIDYQSDYVLMVAEIYSAEDDIATAVRRLALLGNDPPAEIAHRALLFAERQGYTDSDIVLIRALYADLQTWNPALETPIP